jgi:hypothetical protein
MDRLSDQLGLTTISPTIMQAMVDLYRRAGTLPNEAAAAVDAAERNADDLAQLPSVATGGEP